MGFFYSLAGGVQLELTGADIYGTLGVLSEQNIPIHDLAVLNELTVRFVISGNAWNRVKTLCEKRDDSIRVIARMGLRWNLAAVLKRPVLMIGMVLLIVCSWYLPSRVLIVQVEGNSRIPRQQILEAAADCGIRFGASRRLVRSEQMKNSLLGALPQLQWAGINTHGCRAVISVRERPVEEGALEYAGVSSIVASMDGVITECTVTGGNGMCQPGQAVKAGQVLISGYTDCGITIQATRAEGEVTALTRREMTVVTPSEQLLRTAYQQKKTYISLIVGKKRINFYKGSGISGGSCVKMYSKYVLTLPGGFELPLSLVRETVIPTDAKPETIPVPEEMLYAYARSYLSGKMIAGRILEGVEQIHESDGVCCLVGEYACLESIGIRQEEKIGEYNG